MEPTVNPTIDPSTNPTVDPTTEPTKDPINDSTADPTVLPTNQPSLHSSASPTDAPSLSPTRYPITYSDLDSSVIALFNITGWTNSDISDVESDLELFASSLTNYIHQGFDADSNLEYRHIVLSVFSINEYPLDHLINDDDSETREVLRQSIDDGMNLQYLIECSIIDCLYIDTEDPLNGLNPIPIPILNITAFEMFVSSKLNTFFVSTDSTNGDNALSFAVESMTLDTFENTTSTTNIPIEVTTNYDHEVTTNIGLIIMLSAVVCAMCCGVFGVICCYKYRAMWNLSESTSANASYFLRRPISHRSNSGVTMVNLSAPGGMKEAVPESEEDTADVSTTDCTEKHVSWKEGVHGTGMDKSVGKNGMIECWKDTTGNEVDLLEIIPDHITDEDDGAMEDLIICSGDIIEATISDVNCDVARD